MGILDNINQAANNFHNAADNATNQLAQAAGDAKQTADDAAAEANATAKQSAADAQQQTDAAAAAARQQADAAAAAAIRAAATAFSDARRKIDAANQRFQSTVADLRNQVDSAAREARQIIAASQNFIANGTSSLPDMYSWLEAHPSITTQIIWQTTAGLPSPYPLWTPSMRGDLEKAFRKAWDLDSIMQTDPMINRMSLTDDQPVAQVLDHSDAWTMFTAYVAQSLAVEIGNRVQWSILGYSNASLSQLFHGTQMFTWNPIAGGYEIDFQKHGWALPCSPQTGSSFLFNGIIDASNRPSTIAGVLDWCRSNLVHFTGSGTTKDMDDQWQYRGFPPVLKMLTGTPINSDPSAGIEPRTAGCWGTCGFLKAILRTVNVPVQLVVHGEAPNLHALPYFVEDALYLSHGDDPYNQLTTAIPPMPISELLIGQKQFDEWFGPRVNAATQLKNIGRRTKDLATRFLPNALLRSYCADIAAGKGHGDGQVFDIFKDLYSLAELENLSLWSGMDFKIASLGGCANIPPPLH